MRIRVTYEGESPQKIEMIKALREIEGLSLKDGKRLADAIVDGQPAYLNIEESAKVDYAKRTLTDVGFSCEVDQGELYEALKKALLAAVSVEDLKTAHTLMHLLEKAG